MEGNGQASIKANVNVVLLKVGSLVDINKGEQLCARLRLYLFLD